MNQFSRCFKLTSRRQILARYPDRVVIMTRSQIGNGESRKRLKVVNFTTFKCLQANWETVEVHRVTTVERQEKQAPECYSDIVSVVGVSYARVGFILQRQRTNSDLLIAFSVLLRRICKLHCAAFTPAQSSQVKPHRSAGRPKPPVSVTCYILYVTRVTMDISNSSTRQ
jgi:hypothetical protein